MILTRVKFRILLFTTEEHIDGSGSQMAMHHASTHKAYIVQWQLDVFAQCSVIIFSAILCESILLKITSQILSCQAIKYFACIHAILPSKWYPDSLFVLAMKGEWFDSQLDNQWFSTYFLRLFWNVLNEISSTMHISRRKKIILKHCTKQMISMVSIFSSAKKPKSKLLNVLSDRNRNELKYYSCSDSWF